MTENIQIEPVFRAEKTGKLEKVKMAFVTTWFVINFIAQIPSKTCFYTVWVALWLNDTFIKLAPIGLMFYLAWNYEKVMVARPEEAMNLLGIIVAWVFWKRLLTPFIFAVGFWEIVTWWNGM